MAATPRSPLPQPARRKAGRHRGEGQWAAGHFTPLNGNEQTKKDDDGLNVRTRIETIYANARLRLDRRRRPARPDALVGPLHPAQARDRRRQDRDPGAGGAGRRVLHAARPHRRRPADHRAAARHRRDLAGVRPRHRRHHRPAERPVPLDPHRGRARRSGGVWRPSGSPPPRPAATLPASSSARPSPASPRTRSSTARPPIDEIHRRFIGNQGVLEPAAQVQDRDLRLAAAGRRARDQRRRVRRRRTTPSTAPASTSGSAAGCPPTPSSACGSAPGCRWTRSPDVYERRHLRSSATTATAGCAPAPG